MAGFSMAVRPDLCSLRFCILSALPEHAETVVSLLQELEKLQDRVPAFSSQQAVETIEAGLGAPVLSVFESFESKPLAAASLGQVRLSMSRVPLHASLQWAQPLS